WCVAAIASALRIAPFVHAQTRRLRAIIGTGAATEDLAVAHDSLAGMNHAVAARAGALDGPARQIRWHSAILALHRPGRQSKTSPLPRDPVAAAILFKEKQPMNAIIGQSEEPAEKCELRGCLFAELFAMSAENPEGP